MEYAEQPVAQWHIAGANGALLGCDMSVELRKLLLGRAGGKPLDNFLFHNTARVKHLLCFARARLRHEGTSAGPQSYKFILGEPVERLAHLGARYAKDLA